MALGNSGARVWEGFRQGRFTLSILVAPGRFLAFLVRVTLTKLWKAADLGRKKPRSAVRHPDASHQTISLALPSLVSLSLPFAFVL